MSKETASVAGRRRVTVAGLSITFALLIAIAFATDVDARDATHAVASNGHVVTARATGSASPKTVPQTLTVNTTSDTDDGVCDATHCSLREAIKYAVAGASINFSALFDSPQTIQLTSALPVISKNLTIAGPGAPLLEVRGETTGNYQVFDIEAGANAGICCMTVSNSQGGVFNNASTLTLADMVVTEIGGAGVTNYGGGTLTMDSSVVSLNTGGGIYNNHSTLHVTHTLIVGNVTYLAGGGIENYWGVVTIDGSTLANNRVIGAQIGGGALDSESIAPQTDATVTLTNTTISGNSGSTSNDFGGSAITNISTGHTATMVIENCTIVGNSGNAPAAVVAVGDGGSAYITLKNTILDNAGLPNLATTTNGTPAAITSQGTNLASDNGSGFLIASGDLTNTDPRLAPLGNYGGPTPTHLILPGSPAINAGNNTGAPATDQRGVARPVGAKVDIGAVEMNPKVINSFADPGDGTCDATCTLRDAMLAANAAGGTLVDIEFDTTVFASTQTINLGSALPDITAYVDIVGPGANRLTVRRNSLDTYSVFTIDLGATANLSGLTVSNGMTATGGVGGGIKNAGTLTLARMAIDGNQATHGSGGGVYNGGTLTIDDSTISNNTSDDGAGLFNQPGFAHLTNTTISGNTTALNFTGGITNENFGAGPSVVSLLNSTITNNSGSTEGGIYTSSDAVTKLKNTIVAGNSSPNITGTAASSIVSLGNNLANDSGAGFLTASGDVINLNALLAPLADNGGPTRTHALLTGSPGANAGNSFGTPAFDQRGVSRLIGISVDIGAFESDVLFRNGFDSL